MLFTFDLEQLSEVPDGAEGWDDSFLHSFGLGKLVVGAVQDVRAFI